MIRSSLNILQSKAGNMRQRLASSPILYRFLRGVFWSLLGTLVSRLFTFASTIVVARIIGKEGYGEMGMVQSTIGLFGVFAGFGLGATATKFVAQFRQKNTFKTGRIIVLTLVVSLIFSFVFSAICLVSSPWLSANMLNRSDMMPLLWSGSVLLFMSTMNGVISATLTGFEAFRSIARINIWQAATVPFLTIPLVWVYGVQGAICSMSLNSALGLILCSRALGRECLKSSIPTGYTAEIWTEWPLLWHFSLPSMMSSLMIGPATWVTNSMLVHQPNGYGELGLFTAANQWRNIVIVIPGLLSAAILPILAETHGNENKSEFNKTVAFNVHLTWIVALPLTVLILTFGNTLAALFGKQFHEAGPIIGLLMVACFLNIVNGAVGSALTGSGKMWTGMIMNLGWALTLIASTYVMVPLAGGKGLALAYLIAYLVHTIWQMLYLEFKIARTAITGHWALAIFTLLLLSVCIMISFDHLNSIFIRSTILVVSFCPLLNLGYCYLNKIKHTKEPVADESCHSLQ